MSLREPSSRPPLIQPAAEVDVAIVGAGAAGISAARECLARGLSVGIFEARKRIGGRAVTSSFGGHPVDLGAHWMHAGFLNPLLRVGLDRGEPIYRAPGRGDVLIDGRPATPRERRAQSRGFDVADRALWLAAREETDRSIAAVLPTFGPWTLATRRTFTLISGRPLDEVSAKDFPSEEFGNNYFVRGGYGAFLARLTAGLPVALGCPVRSVDWSGGGVRLETDGGSIKARAAIVTLPATVLASGAIRFRPGLPDALAAALAGFRPGTYEHVVLNWPHAPFRENDRLVRFVSGRVVNGLMGRMDGAPIHYMELGFEEIAQHAPRGPDAVARFARESLVHHLGAAAIRGLRVIHVTDWVGDPWSQGAWAVALPGRHGDRALLSEPVGERLWFAGEANMPAMWGTVGGAWESGAAAAVAVADRLAVTPSGKSHRKRPAREFSTAAS